MRPVTVSILLLFIATVSGASIAMLGDRTSDGGEYASECRSQLMIADSHLRHINYPHSENRARYAQAMAENALDEARGNCQHAGLESEIQIRLQMIRESRE